MPESSSESINIPAAGPSALRIESHPSNLLGNRVKAIAATVVAAAGLSLALLNSETPTASAAKTTSVPEIAQPDDFTAELEDSSPVERGESLEVGVATYNWEHDRPGTLFDEMGNIGMTGVRLSLIRQRWSEDLADIRAQLPEARENGIEPTINLGQVKGAPLEGFAGWAADTAGQLPSVKRFIIQNEVNSPLFSDDTMQENVDLQYKTYKAIKAVRPDAEIGAFGLASQYDPVGFLRAAAAYAENKYGGLENIMDYLDIHIYYQPEKAGVFLKDVEAVWDGPIAIGEAGYGVENSGQAYESDGFVTEEEQARFTIDMIKMLSEHPQVMYLHNYRLANSLDPMDLKTGFMTATGEKRAAYFALKSFLFFESSQPGR